MPFTVAHPVIIFPLLRVRRLSATGLIIGSIIPDMEFIVQMREVENIGHHLPGIFLFDLPAAILCAYLFHYIVRDTFIEHIPHVVRKRLGPVKGFDWHQEISENSVYVLISFLIGILSHFIWDGFTHHDGYFVTLFPLLASQIVWLNINIPVYFALQIIFSIAGLMMVGSIFLDVKSIWKAAIHWRRIPAYWTYLLSTMLLLLCIRIFVWPDENSMGDIMLGIMGSNFYSVVIVSIFYNYPSKKNTMEPLINSFQIIDRSKKQFLVSVQKDFTGRGTETIRKMINSLDFNHHDSLYFDTTAVEKIDLAGVNQIIQINEMMRSRKINFILAYKRNSEMEQWVNTTGMDLYLDTAILP